MHYTVLFKSAIPELATVGSLEHKNVFKERLKTENWEDAFKSLEFSSGDYRWKQIKSWPATTEMFTVARRMLRTGMKCWDIVDHAR